MLSSDDAAGTDLVWLAADADGLLAAFVTAGEGPIPATALESALTEPGLEAQLLHLPVSSSHQLLTDVPNPTSFIELSQRGLFVFDWTDVHRMLREATHKYELVCRPDRPLSVSELPPVLRAVARSVIVDGVAFARHASISINRAA